MILRGKNVIIAPLGKEDLAELWSWVDKDGVREFFEHMNWETVEDFYQHHVNTMYGTANIYYGFHTPQGRLVAAIYTTTNYDDSVVFTIMHDGTFSGARMMYEALPLLRAHAWNGLGLWKVTTFVSPKNTRAHALIDRFDMTLEGHFRHKHGSQYCYSVFRDEEVNG